MYDKPLPIYKQEGQQDRSESKLLKVDTKDIQNVMESQSKATLMAFEQEEK
jgi:hypothetical protein